MSRQSGIQHLDCAVAGHLAVHTHLQFPAAFFELPCVYPAMREKAEVDAVVADEILRFLRLRPLAEVIRRSDDGHAQIRSDAHRDHVLGNLLAASHAGVVAIGNNVAQPVVNDDLDFDIGILRQKCSEFWQQDRVGSVFRRGNSDMPAGFSRNSRTAETSASISSKRGPMVCSRRSRPRRGNTAGSTSK